MEEAGQHEKAWATKIIIKGYKKALDFAFYELEAIKKTVSGLNKIRELQAKEIKKLRSELATAKEQIKKSKALK